MHNAKNNALRFVFARIFGHCGINLLTSNLFDAKMYPSRGIIGRFFPKTD